MDARSDLDFCFSTCELRTSGQGEFKGGILRVAEWGGCLGQILCDRKSRVITPSRSAPQITRRVTRESDLGQVPVVPVPVPVPLYSCSAQPAFYFGDKIFGETLGISKLELSLRKW